MWEYDILDLDAFYPGQWVAEMDDMGANGWELVSVAWPRAFFKRERK